MLNKEEHNNIINEVVELLKAETIDISSVTSRLENLRTNYNDAVSFEENCNKLKEDNEKLRSANMDLFLKLGDSKDSKPSVENVKENNIVEKNTNGLQELADEFLK